MSRRPTLSPPNLLDRALAVVAPRLARDRLRSRWQFEAAASSAGGYSGADRGRRSMKQWKPRGGDADSELLPALPVLRDNARDLVRNEPIAGGAIATVTSNVVGTGLKLQARVDREALGLADAAADAWERQAERAFRLWADSPECDVARTLTFAGLQELAFRSTLEAGDVFVWKRMLARPGGPFELKLQLVEADRVSNPNGQPDSARFAGGVELDGFGAPVAYHVQVGHPGGLAPQERRWERFEAFGARSGLRNVLHLYRPLRPGQTRGVPYLAPVIEALKQASRYSEAEIMAAVINACFAIGTKTETGDGSTGFGSDGEDADGKAIRVTEPGQIFDLRLNEEIQSFTPGRPSAAFEPFFMAIMKQVAVALELPFEVLLKHFTASYSASQAALMVAWRFFIGRRVWLAQALCQPVYESFLVEAVAKGRLDAPGFFSDPALRAAWCGAEWVGPARGQIDGLKEANAAEKRIAIGLTTLDQETAELTGGDFERNHAQRVKEKRLRVEGGLEADASMPAPGQAAAPPKPAEDDDEDEDEQAGSDEERPEDEARPPRS